MKVGYIRVSTEEQNTERQEALMRELGAGKVFMEKATGNTREDRAQLEAMLQYVREGDVVVAESISRIARNTKDLLDIVERLEYKGVDFISKKEAIDTKTPSGKFMLTVFGAIAQLEREYILDRQREGIEIAKEKGKYKGRPAKQLDTFDEIYHQWKSGNITATMASKQMEISRSTFYRKVVEYEENNSAIDF